MRSLPMRWKTEPNANDTGTSRGVRNSYCFSDTLSFFREGTTTASWGRRINQKDK